MPYDLKSSREIAVDESQGLRASSPPDNGTTSIREATNLKIRIHRQLSRILAKVSLVLFLGTVALWGRSYFRADGIDYGSAENVQFRQQSESLRSDSGILAYHHSYFEFSESGSRLRQPAGWLNYPVGLHAYIGSSGRVDMLAGARDLGFEFLGFGYVSGAETFPATGPWSYRLGGFAVFTPYWSLVLIFAAAPAHQLIVQRRENRRRQRSQCVRCGYNIRASKDRCPECGEPIPQKTRFSERVN